MIRRMPYLKSRLLNLDRLSGKKRKKALYWLRRLQQVTEES